ncbi:MAG TPA: 3'-5' exonuclease [Vicinamibacterales bacterium]|nr:3'-5' exonuclease [Vicinamibacterales bacterium]
MSLLRFFHTPWHEVPTVWIDTETTGVRPGVDRAVQVGLARFEGGKCVGSGVQLVNPGIPIPPEATAIHGITDERVAAMPTIEHLFREARALALLDGAQPAAYNAPFDRHFVPPFGDDWTWQWLDALSLVRVVDRFVRGNGRHRLEAAAERHGVALPRAHNAEADAVAAGMLFYKLAPTVFAEMPLGELLREQTIQEAQERYRFHNWLSQQPPRDGSTS